MASIGLAKTMKTAFGEAFAAAVATSRTMPALMLSSSSRVMPGLRGSPEVMTTTSEPLVSSQPLLPVSLALKPTCGADSARSSDLPCGNPSTMSCKTTST